MPEEEREKYQKYLSVVSCKEKIEAKTEESILVAGRSLLFSESSMDGTLFNGKKFFLKCS